MDTSQLQELAQRSRSTREAGFGLLVASAVLALFLYFPLGLNVASEPAPALTPPVSAFENLQLEAKAAIVYDLTAKEPLYEMNADAQLPLASLTKLLSVYAALSILSPETPITIPASVVRYGAANGLREGQVFALSDLARITLTASLNDGSEAIMKAAADRALKSHTQALAGVAAALGLSQTFAVNGSGLDENQAVSGGYGSARDLAVLAGALVALAPDIAAATTDLTATAVSKGGTAITVNNTDPIVDTLPHMLLSKTGFTALAQGNLALVFDVGIGHPVAVVVLGSSEKARFTDGAALVAATLAHFAGVASL